MFWLIVALIVICITICTIVERVAAHKEYMTKLERSNFICKTCCSQTPVVLVKEPYQGGQ